MNVDDALGRAHALVKHAEIAAAEGDSLAAAVTGMRCFEVAAMLEECGARPDADLLSGTPTAGARQLLNEAAAVLDGIPAAERPLRLVSVRVKLAGALLAVEG